MLNYIKGLLNEEPELRRMILGRPTRTGIRLKNRTQISIHTASFRTTRGYTLAAALGDEIAFWRSEETSTNPDKEILNALRPGLLTSKGPLVVITSPYARRGVLWEQYKAHFGKEGDPVLVWQGTSQEMNPGLDQAIIDAAYEADPAAASAEYGAQFRSERKRGSTSHRIIPGGLQRAHMTLNRRGGDEPPLSIYAHFLVTP